MRVGRFSIALAALGVVVAFAAGTAQAAPKWQSPITVASVRGIPDPQVGIDRNGKTTAVYSDAPLDALYAGPGIYVVIRYPGGTLSKPRRIGDGVDPQISVAPSGDTAIAWVDRDHVEILRQPAPGVPTTVGQVRRTIATGAVGHLRLVLDGTGRATLLWTSPTRFVVPPEPVQLKAVAISSTGYVGAVEELGEPAACTSLSVGGNLAGDVGALCSKAEEAHVRAPGQALFDTVAFPSREPDPTLGIGPGEVVVDGSGTVTVVTQFSGHGATTAYRDHPRGGVFGPSRSFGVAGAGLVTFVAQESRTVAVWSARDGVGYSVRPAGGDFGPARLVRGADPEDVGLVDVTAPLGPLPLLIDRPPVRPLEPASLVALSVDASGAGRALGTPAIPGAIDVGGNVAAAENGLAAAVWEQRCGQGYAVMAMVLDERRGTSVPPCQDRRAPKVVVRPKRARLVGRTVRVRIGCDEKCRIGVRTRVLGTGSRRPLATAKTKRAALLGARHLRTFKLRLSPTEAFKLSGALAVGRRVTVRLALPVRDSYENGAVRRVAVPLRR